jgi:hypothetical protein
MSAACLTFDVDGACCASCLTNAITQGRWVRPVAIQPALNALKHRRTKSGSGLGSGNGRAPRNKRCSPHVRDVSSDVTKKRPL